MSMSRKLLVPLLSKVKSIKMKSMLQQIIKNQVNPSQQPAMLNNKEDKVILNLRIKKNLLDSLKIRVKYKKLSPSMTKIKQITQSIKKRPLKKMKKKLRLKRTQLKTNTLKILLAIKKSRGY